jgi:hypothetical protein
MKRRDIILSRRIDDESCIVMEKLINILMRILNLYLVIVAICLLFVGVQAITFAIANGGAPDNGIFDCGQGGVYISGEHITINTTAEITTPEIIENFEKCLYWHILESEVGSE